MGLVNSYDEKTIESLKNYLSTYDLSKKIKSILSEYSVEVLDHFEKGFGIDTSDFNDVIEDYFEQLEFCYHNYDDSNILNIKDKIGDLFQYIDSLDLEESYKFDLIRNFFSRFSDDINESRGFYDLITLDSIYNSNAMNDYLNSDLVGGKFALFTKKLYTFLNSLSDLDREKVSYVFRSSYEVLAFFIEDNDSDLEFYFRKALLKGLTKEEISLIFRTSYFKKLDMFFDADPRFIKVFLLMRDYVYENLGRSSEFLDSVFRIFDNASVPLINRYVNYFIEYYNNYYDKDKNLKEDEIFNELLSYTFDCNGDLSIINDGILLNLSSFHEAWMRAEDEKYERALISGRIGLLKLKLDIFDIQKDSFNYNDIEAVKNLYFSRMYGLYIDQVRYLYRKYGKFLDLATSEIDEKDRETFLTLKSICNMYTMDLHRLNNFNGFQCVFRNFLKNNGLYKTTDGLSFVSLRDRIDMMYQNAFNKVLFKVEDGKVLRKVRGVSVIDPGVNFSMVVNAINGVGEFFEVDEGFNKKYNTTNSSNNSGICASFIDNQNLGVVSLKGPLLGYGNLDLCHLHAMGVGDIYSETETMSLKNSNSSSGEGRYFATPRVLTDWTRFGYNELVLDRFYSDDKDNKIKVQPSYIVVYKIDDNYTKTRMYKRGLRMAKEFDIPLVLVDVVKVKENEKTIINKLEEELFSHRSVNSELVSSIITRYMNNYTGSLTITRSREERGNRWDYKHDFSEEGLNEFFEKLEERFSTLTFVEIKEWAQVLRCCYEKEREKNSLATEICEYGCSLTKEEFYLKDMGFLQILDNISRKHIDRYIYECGLVEDDKVMISSCSSDVKACVNLANYLYECSYVTINNENEEKVYMSCYASELSREQKDAYGLIISYLFGDYKHNYFDSLCSTSSDIKFNTKNKSFMNGVNSSVFKDMTKSPVLMRVVDTISRMDMGEFYDIFDPIIDGVKNNEVITKMLAVRKGKIKEEFSKLPEKAKIKVKKSGD